MARVAVPGLIVSTLSAGVAVAVRPASSADSAVPAPRPTSTQTSSPSSGATPSGRSDRVNRNNARPSVTSAPSSTSTSDTSKKATAKLTAKPSATKPEPIRTTAKPAVVGLRYTTVDLNMRTKPGDDGSLITVLQQGARMSVTDNKVGAWQQILRRERTGWVRAAYLTSKKPEPAQEKPVYQSAREKSASSAPKQRAASGSPDGSCPGGSSVESGLTAEAVGVHRAVCHQFPQITSYGGVRADSLPEHPSGRAVDVMLPTGGAGSNALGWQIANWLQANSGRLGISQLIFDQKIWTMQRGSEGWRPMPSRGGATADHRDHVHVTV